MSWILVTLLFMQAFVDPPAFLADVVSDANSPSGYDLQFHDDPPTVWMMDFKQNCDWVADGQEIVWNPFGSGSVGTINLPGNTNSCTTDTVSLPDVD